MRHEFFQISKSCSRRTGEIHVIAHEKVELTKKHHSFRHISSFLMLATNHLHRHMKLHAHTHKNFTIWPTEDSCPASPALCNHNILHPLFLFYSQTGVISTFYPLFIFTRSLPLLRSCPLPTPPAPSTSGSQSQWKLFSSAQLASS